MKSENKAGIFVGSAFFVVLSYIAFSIAMLVWMVHKFG